MANKRVLLQNRKRFFFGDIFRDTLGFSDIFGDNCHMNAEIFRHNLREMLRARGLKQRDFAEKAGLSYPWVRKICSQGLTRVEDRNREQLKIVCGFLGVSPIERMWSENLLRADDEASLYASKVREIMIGSSSPADEHLDTDTIDALVSFIDMQYAVLDRKRSNESRQPKSKGKAADHQPGKAKQNADYPAKLRALLQLPEAPFKLLRDSVLPAIDGAFFKEVAEQVRLNWRETYADRHDEWLEYFQTRIVFDLSIGAALESFSEAEITEYLGNHLPPSKTEPSIFEQIRVLKTGLEWRAELPDWIRKHLTYPSPAKQTRLRPELDEEDSDLYEEDSDLDEEDSDVDWEEIWEKGGESN